jgi:hypothetical protein
VTAPEALLAVLAPAGRDASPPSTLRASVPATPEPRRADSRPGTARRAALQTRTAAVPTRARAEPVAAQSGPRQRIPALYVN